MNSPESKEYIWLKIRKEMNKSNNIYLVQDQERKGQFSKGQVYFIQWGFIKFAS